MIAVGLAAWFLLVVGLIAANHLARVHVAAARSAALDRALEQL